MAVNWGAVKATIKEVITDVSVDQITSAGGVYEPFFTPKWEAVWENKKEGANFIHPGQSLAVYLKVTTESEVSEVVERELDEGIVMGSDPPGALNGVPTGVMNVFEVTEKRSRITVNIRALKVEDDDLEGALGVLNRIRTRLPWQEPQAKLIDANIALWEMGPAREAPIRGDNRMLSVASMDVLFDIALEEVNPTPVGWIERIIHTSHIGVEGVDLPAPPNVIDEMLPDTAEATGEVVFSITATGTLQGL